MTQPDAAARKEYFDIVEDNATTVAIKGTKRKVNVRGIKPYTIERLTRLWQEREATMPDSSSEVLRSVCTDPYFAIKEACLIVLNDYWKIRLFFPLKWRIWAYFRQYSEAQMFPIISEGKKKLPLMEHWTNMAYSVDMRMDWTKLTAKEAEQYRAELLSAAKQLSSRSSTDTASQEGSSSGS